MSQKPGQPQGLLDTLQSEVAPEASPLLEFLKKHTGAIILGFVIAIVAIGGYLYYGHKTSTANLAQQQELGKILVVADPKTRLNSLEQYFPNAPASLKNQTLLAIIQAATETGDTEKVLDSWQQLSKENENYKQLSTIATTAALAQSGKYEEALAILEDLLPQVSTKERPFILRSILNYAEIVGDTARAIKACEDLLAENVAPQAPAGSDALKYWNAERTLLQQQLAMLRLKTE